MARNKYIYRHYVKNQEVSKEAFLRALQEHFMKCDTNYDNALLNVSYVDYDALKRKYEYLKRTGTILVYCGSNSFYIRRKLVSEKN